MINILKSPGSIEPPLLFRHRHGHLLPAILTTYLKTHIPSIRIQTNHLTSMIDRKICESDRKRERPLHVHATITVKTQINTERFLLGVYRFSQCLTCLFGQFSFVDNEKCVCVEHKTADTKGIRFSFSWLMFHRGQRIMLSTVSNNKIAFLWIC